MTPMLLFLVKMFSFFPGRRVRCTVLAFSPLPAFFWSFLCLMVFGVTSLMRNESQYKPSRKSLKFAYIKISKKLNRINRIKEHLFFLVGNVFAWFKM